MSSRRTRDAVQIMDRRFGGDAEWDRMVIEEEIKAQVAETAYQLREEARLTQAELAQRIGVTQAMISKIENADHDGSYLDLLLRICVGLQRKLEVTRPRGRRRGACGIRIPA